MKNFGIFILLLFVMSCQKENQESIVSKQLEVSDNELINYVEYCNSRFDICFDYPSNFSVQPEPVNGDGRTFKNDIDSSEIVLSGFHDQGNEGIEAQLAILEQIMEIDTVIEFQDGYDVRGIDKEDGRVHFEKLMIKADSKFGHYDDGTPVNTIYSLQFIYPKSKEHKYRDYWEKMTAKFK